MRPILLFLGIIIFLFSMILAFYFKYNHFYEFLVAGMFISLYSLLPKNYINFHEYFYLYLVFISFGLIADLFLGLSIAKLWFYSYSTYLEYVPLYFFIYPVGGIIMVQTYLLSKKIFRLSVIHTSKTNVNLRIGFYLATLISFVLLLFRSKIPYFGFFLFCSGSIFGFLILNYISQKLRKTSYIDEFAQRPSKIFFITLISSYFQALIHEIPNGFAKQWIYQNWILTKITLFGLPVSVLFLGWIALTIIPLSAYYCIKK